MLQETECLNPSNSFLFSVDKENVLSIWTLLHSDVLTSAFKYSLPAYSHLLYMNHMVRLYFWGMHSIVICLTFHLDQPWLLLARVGEEQKANPISQQYLHQEYQSPCPQPQCISKNLFCHLYNKIYRSNTVLDSHLQSLWRQRSWRHRSIERSQSLDHNQCCVQQSERPRSFADWTIENDVRAIVQ